MNGRPRPLRPRRALGAVACALVVAAARQAAGDEPVAGPDATGGAAGATDATSQAAVALAPPPTDIPYIQYGFALTSEAVASAGAMCPSNDPNCILGSGGGIAVRVGRRSAGPWYFGGAYELSKQDPASLYRFATLQQLRAEARYYLPTGLDTQPFATAGAGIAAYGNEWSVDTFGPMLHVGIGGEAQLSRRTVVSMMLSYRLLLLQGFVDSSGRDRPESLAQLLSLEVALEQRDPVGPLTSR